MMSPGPPPQPIYPRSSNVISSTMAESPRPIHPAAFAHQLPPIMPTSHFSISGPVLAPLAMPGTTSGPSPVPRTAPQSPQSVSHISHQRRGPPPPPPPPVSTHAPPPPPPHHSGSLSHHNHPPQQPPPPPPPHHERRAPSYDAHHRLLSSQPAFNSPSPSGFPSPSSFSPFERSFDNRRFSSDTEQDRRRSSLSSMVPSPSFPVTRSFDESPSYPDESSRSSYVSTFNKPAPTDENAASHGEAFPRRSPGRYQIEVRQQPVAARACGFGERDRRVIDPPPIVQLVVNDPAGHSDASEMRYPFNVVHCTLWSVDGNTDETALIGVDKRLTRRLMGTLVSSPFVGLDEEGKEGCFFCFPDLSCRTHGKYRLRFVLMRLEPSDLQPEGYTPIITEALSEVFTVYTAKEFPGMRPSTALTKALKRQGCAISVKKGNEKAGGQVGGSGKDDGSGDEDTPSSTGGKSKRRRKT